MLELHDVAFDGHHGRLVEPTSFSVPDGGLAVLQAPTAMMRTALALIASGRMAPDAGEVRIDGVAELRPLRLRTALVDAPTITAPEHHMTVKNVVSEFLALRPLRSRVGKNARRIGVRAWLAEHDAEDLAGARIDTLEPLERVGLLLELAFSDPQVRFAVVDSPDRHEVDRDQLLDFLEDRCSVDHDRAVLAVLEEAPAREDIPCGFAGHHEGPFVLSAEHAEDPEAEAAGVTDAAGETAAATQTTDDDVEATAAEEIARDDTTPDETSPDDTEPDDTTPDTDLDDLLEDKR
ncbi:hypothetical protein [Nesterenkonia sp. PF2B19]|uniref:hypothetical protein n=1 Tax=Nesterenkonia sp. PF2B19 TaxID=1881858 RepID=UPI00111C420E|nr:hypothetical protein [Nesterenkonia sp. PF2B19]